MATLSDRVIGLITQPTATWDVIRAEPLDREALVKGYVLPLAAIGPVANLIGQTVFGMVGDGAVSFGLVLATSLASFLLSVAGVFIFAFILNALAPTFGARQDLDHALKVSAYAPTAAWVAGVFLLLPFLGILTLLGLYSLVLLMIGNPRVMRPAPEKETAYTVTALVVAVILAFIAGGVHTAILAGSVAGMAH